MPSAQPALGPKRRPAPSLLAEMEADADRGPTEDVAKRAVAEAKKFAEKSKRRDELEEELKKLVAELNEIKHKKLPDLLAEAGTDRLGIPEMELDAVAKDYYHANIAADWTDERREAAFAFLEREKAGDLIKVVVSVSFGRREWARALAFAERVRKAGFEPRIDKGVPWATLTAYVREQWPKWQQRWTRGDKRLPPVDKVLDLLGATVGRIVELKKRN